MDSSNIDLTSIKVNSDSRTSGSRIRNNSLILILAVISVILLSLFIYRKLLYYPPVEVKLTKATLQSSVRPDTILKAGGYVIAQRKAAVASKASGRLIFLGFSEGDKVRKDQVIATLEDNDIRAQLMQSKANLKLYQADLKEAENNYKRQEILFKTGGATKVDVEASESRYNRVLASIEAAKAGIAASEIALENILIRAPFDGTILTKNADLGEIVAPLNAGMNSKSTVVTIADMKSLQVDSDVSEAHIQKIHIDQDCDIILDAYPDHVYKGYVAKIVPTANRTKATVLVKVGFRNYDEKVLPEMGAKVTFFKESDFNNTNTPAVLIPISALARLNEKDVVYFVSDNKAKRLFISTGRRLGNYIEVIHGLSNGDMIINNPGEEIKEGFSVVVK